MTPGSIVFAHSGGIMAKAIRFGERLRWKKGSHWNHACVISRVEDGVAFVIQADLRGVNEASLESVGEYTIVELPEGVSADKVLEFTRAQLGTKYSLLSIVSILIDIVTPNWFPEFRRDSTWICSAVTGEALRAAGWFTPKSNWGSIYTITPSQLYDALIQ